MGILWFSILKNNNFISIMWILIQYIQGNLISVHFYFRKASIVIHFWFFNIYLKISRLSRLNNSSFVNYGSYQLSWIGILGECIRWAKTGTIKVQLIPHSWALSLSQILWWIFFIVFFVSWDEESRKWCPGYFFCTH